MKRLLLILALLLTGFSSWAQKPGTTPVKVNFETQMRHGRKYYVHIVEKGQTVYSIAKAYRVQSHDAITHVDIHALHPGDTVWLPFRGQFSEEEVQSTLTQKQTTPPVNTIHVRDTVYVDRPYAVHDTTYINVPYAVHDTIFVTDTVTLTKYETVRDTTYINIPYAVHDTTVVTDKVTQTEYVPVHDTIFVTDTVTLTKYETVRDTTYINIPYAVHDTTVVTDKVTQTEYVPVHDTIFVTDTVTLTKYETVRDTTYINIPYAVHDTTVVTDKVTQMEYVPVHDTTIVTKPVTQTEYVTVHDTTYIKVPVHDTTIVTKPVTQTEYVTVHDTTYIKVPVHDTTIVTKPVTQTEYVTVHDTTYITVRDTMVVTDTVTLTEYVPVHDTTYIDVPAPTDALAYASTSAVALTEYVRANQPATSPVTPATTEAVPVERTVGKTLRVGLMMPLHLDQMAQISTSKFDVEQRGKKSYRQFEFIEFYEGILLALDKLAEQGVNVELNVVDVSDNTPAKVEEAWTSHNVGQSDFVVALLLRDCFDKAAELAQQAGVYIVNPMATRSELCAENPYIVKVQPSLEGMVSLMLANMKVERPDGHLYIIHSNAKAEKVLMDELKRQLTERGDIKYTIFNWSQSARLASVLKATPKCNVLSIYEQGKDNNRVFTINLLNRLSSIKKDSPTLYTLNDWTREYGDIDFSQLQLLGYHTYSLSWDMTNEVHVQFLKDFRTRFGTEPTSQLASTGYDLMLYLVGGLVNRNNDFWQHPSNSLPTLIQPLHLVRHGAGLENDKAQLYRMENLRFIKALYK